MSNDAPETPLEKVQQWLTIAKNPDGHFKSGDWAAPLIPHLEIESVSEAMPHPSVVFSYTIQPDNCNRLQNLHGGCAATIFDWCTTLPLALVAKPGFWMFMGVSRTLNVTYMRPAPVGTEVLIECEIVQIGKNMCTLRGVMRRKDNGAILSICEHGKVSIDPPASKI